MAADSNQRSIVVTGSSSGIGEAVAVQLAQDGWKVFAGVRKVVDANRLRQVHNNIHPVFLDVTSEEQITKAFDEVRSAVGDRGLDALVNNAGVSYPCPIEFVPVTTLETQFDVNVFGQIRVTQAAMPLLRLGTPGRIINVGSIGGQLNYPYCGPYCATKSALESLSEVLRREVARWGIKVSLIKPGPVESKIWEAIYRKSKQISSEMPSDSAYHHFYGKDIDQFEEGFEAFKRISSPASKVVTTIKKALNDKNPKNMYFDTWGTWYMMKKFGWTRTSKNDANFAAMAFMKD